MKSSRILLLAACCALAPSAWAGAGLTSAGVDPNAGNNNAQDEPTLAQVAPTANQTGVVSAGANASAANPAAAGAAGANAPNAANSAAGESKTPAPPAVVAPAPPPPPPDPSTLPVSVIRPLNKSGEDSPPPRADAVSAVTATAKTARHPPSDGAAEPMPAQTRAPAPAPAHIPQAAPTRPETARTAVDVAAATTAPTSATADGSANGFVFYTGMGLAGIILALSFFGYMRAGNDAGRPRA